MQLRQALYRAIEQLEALHVEQARLQAEALLLHVLGCDRAFLFAHPERELSADEEAQYEQLIARRAAGEPLQYLTGHQEFWKADFLVTPDVLIPRPETEHLVEAVLELARGMLPPGPAHIPRESGQVGTREPQVNYPTQAKGLEWGTRGEGGAPALAPRLKLIDVGTGSGAIAVSLARELPQAEVYAVDLSPEALEVARRNAERLGARVRFAQSDVLAAVARDASFDFVVSNPPYIGLREADSVQEVVRRHEPAQALFAGDDGLDVIRRLIPQAGEALRPGGWLVFEIGYGQEEAVRALLSPQHANSGRAADPGPGCWHEVHTTADLAGIARVMLARKPRS